MLQMNSKVSFLPSRRSRDAEALLVRLHEVDDVSKLAKVTFELIESHFPYQFIILLFRHLEFDLPCRYLPLKYKAVVDEYMAENHKCDIWLQRSPVNPHVSVVRHSDYTPQHLLHRSPYFRKVLVPLDSEYGASVVAWRDTTWLTTLTVMRNKEQGDFTDEEMEELHALQPHFACVIRRLARYQETRLMDSSVRHVMSSLPTATLILDWNLNVKHYNAFATHLCSKWKSNGKASFLKTPRRLQVPGDILAELGRMRPSIMAQKWGQGPGGRRSLHRDYQHPSKPSLSASIEFLPSRSLTLSKGTFLLTLKEERRSEEGLNLSEKLNQLTRRERDCAVLAAQGLHNRDIAQKLGKSEITVRNQLSSIYRKLGLNTRHKLIAAFARIDAQVG
jgi:Response regulator containing a CheY-like receiver domain and an HTH DNA-binding domain